MHQLQIVSSSFEEPSGNALRVFGVNSLNFKGVSMLHEQKEKKQRDTIGKENVSVRNGTKGIAYKNELRGRDFILSLPRRSWSKRTVLKGNEQTKLKLRSQRPKEHKLKESELRENGTYDEMLRHCGNDHLQKSLHPAR
jgi:hypothetical protein